MSKKTIIETACVIVGGIAIFLLLKSAMTDLRPEPRHIEDRKVVSAASQKLLTAPGKTLNYSDYNQLIYQFPDFPWRKLPVEPLPKPSPETEDQQVRHAIIESAISGLSKRVEILENDRTGMWAMIKAVLAWFLATFLAPVVADLGKRAFRIQS